MSYACLSSFGASAGNSAQNDPITYCALSGLESGMYHSIGGGNNLVGPNSVACQIYMGQYCAKNWDGTCEFLSKNEERRFPNWNGSYNMMWNSSGIGNGITSGQILIRNAAAEKYIVAMSDNCYRDLQPFDPTVPMSPLIGVWRPKMSGSQRNICVPKYDVDPKTIDNDIVMDKLLLQPWIAMDILGGIYQSRLANKNLEELRGTKLYNWFMTNLNKDKANKLPSQLNQPVF